MSNPYTGEERREPQPGGWHLKKEVNVTIIISVIGIAITMVTGYSDLKRDIALIQADNVVLHQRDTQLASDTSASVSLIRFQYERLDAKLDRIIERGQR